MTTDWFEDLKGDIQKNIPEYGDESRWPQIDDAAAWDRILARTCLAILAIVKQESNCKEAEEVAGLYRRWIVYGEKPAISEWEKAAPIKREFESAGNDAATWAARAAGAWAEDNAIDLSNGKTAVGVAAFWASETLHGSSFDEWFAGDQLVARIRTYRRIAAALESAMIAESQGLCPG